MHQINNSSILVIFLISPLYNRHVPSCTLMLKMKDYNKKHQKRLKTYDQHKIGFSIDRIA